MIIALKSSVWRQAYVEGKFVENDTVIRYFTTKRADDNTHWYSRKSNL